MPVYKLTEKRLARQEKEEKEGKELQALLAKLEQAEGADESEDDDDDEVDDDDDDGDEDESSDDEGSDGYPESIGTMDSEDDSSDDEDDDEDDDEEDEDEDDEEVDGNGDQEDSEAESDDFFTLTIDQVASNPTYSLPTPPFPANCSACVICPGRIFKNEHMVTEHAGSKAHKRASKRWDERVKLAESGQQPFESDDPREIVAAIMEELIAQRDGLVQIKNEPAENDGPSRKRKRSRKERKEEVAKSMVAAQAAESQAAKSKSKGNKRAKTADAVEAVPQVKMNRKARRLAAKQALETK